MHVAVVFELQSKQTQKIPVLGINKKLHHSLCSSNVIIQGVKGMWARNQPHPNTCPDFEWYFKALGEARKRNRLHAAGFSAIWACNLERLHKSQRNVFFLWFEGGKGSWGSALVKGFLLASHCLPLCQEHGGAVPLGGGRSFWHWHFIRSGGCSKETESLIQSGLFCPSKEMQQIFSVLSRGRKRTSLSFCSHPQITSHKTERTSYHITASVLIKSRKSALLHWQDPFYMGCLWEHETPEEGSLCWEQELCALGSDWNSGTLSAWAAHHRFHAQSWAGLTGVYSLSKVQNPNPRSSNQVPFPFWTVIVFMPGFQVFSFL